MFVPLYIPTVVTVVVPAFNESGAIGQVVDETTQTIVPTGNDATEFHVAKPGGLPAGTGHEVHGIPGPGRLSRDCRDGSVAAAVLRG